MKFAFLLTYITNTDCIKYRNKAYCNILALFIESVFEVEKMNIASIGNVVSQLHIHVVGRHHNDPCWPNVVWGCSKFETYTADRLSSIIFAMDASFKEKFGVSSIK